MDDVLEMRMMNRGDLVMPLQVVQSVTLDEVDKQFQQFDTVYGISVQALCANPALRMDYEDAAMELDFLLAQKRALEEIARVTVRNRYARGSRPRQQLTNQIGRDALLKLAA